MFGIYKSIKASGKKVSDFCQTEYFKQKRGKSTFIFNKHKYKYFIHPYNYTWKNERIIEIPIIKKIVGDNKGKDILEIGNVLSHYGLTGHDVLDKYETAYNVINKDVVSFKTQKKYDLIISVSTLEHVGWDEETKDGTKVLKAISNLKKLLKFKGKIIITHPLGYNKNMDTLIASGKILFKSKFFLLRTSIKNTWKQTHKKEKLDVRYGYPYFGANGVLVGVLK